MARVPLSRPSPAMTVALVALVISCAGTGYAAIKLPANSVGTSQLRRSAVTRVKLKANAVDSTKVLDDALSGSDIRESGLAKVPAAASADNAANAARAANADRSALAASADHATSSAAVDKVTYKLARGSVPPAPSSASFSIGSVNLQCDAGQRPTGAGVRLSDPASQFVVDGDVAEDVTQIPATGIRTSGYVTRVANADPASAHDFGVTVICVAAGGG